MELDEIPVGRCREPRCGWTESPGLRRCSSGIIIRLLRLHGMGGAGHSGLGVPSAVVIHCSLPWRGSDVRQESRRDTDQQNHSIVARLGWEGTLGIISFPALPWAAAPPAAPGCSQPQCPGPGWNNLGQREVSLPWQGMNGMSFTSL